MDVGVKSRLPEADHLAKSGEHPNIAPKDASTLIILDRSGGGIRFLAGRRSDKHVFMPGFYVFPGGRLDRSDHSSPRADSLHPAVAEKLLQFSGRRMNPRRAEALGVAAIRETFEETGLVIGKPQPAQPGRLGFLPSIAHLRFVARAITPPGRIKRFDTRFFAVFADEVDLDPASAKSSHELENLEWVPLADYSTIKVPSITRTVLGDLAETLDIAPALPFGRPVPFYHVRHRRFFREEL
ncbi:NUDIX hydrolase [Rhizobium sp. L1K21]|uniref:NUDIX hydrolase n=1 Tax=Rhizobium sp. L1K21 TaxID=2954933 RepID=UPI0020931EB9|nr:NUDIX hydrolase [Rhizobium sp. L1K21]MCO6186022.1 NUDIX hydrolase [Rhizobium sp. L1K21]